jgi:hypothetical protein
VAICLCKGLYPNRSKHLRCGIISYICLETQNMCTSSLKKLRSIKSF